MFFPWWRRRKLAYFAHIPKTGGQTLLRGFYHAFGRDNCLKIWQPENGGDLASDGFHELEPRRFNRVEAVVGHLPVSTFLANPHMRARYEAGEVVVFASVREPIRRLLSLRNYVAHFARHHLHEIIREMDPIQYILSCPDNGQYGFLKTGEPCDLDAIFRSIEVCPVEHSIAGLERFLLRHFNKSPGALVIRNRTQDHAPGQRLLAIEDLGSDVLAQLVARHQLDARLHEQALERWARQTDPSAGPASA